MSLKLGSLFSGIGGFELVGSWYDIEPVWASEIEPAPIRITTKHFPAMKHYGDITKMHGNDVEPVDIITGGSPCFPAGTMVYTCKSEDGEFAYVPIEDIQTGDSVLTHNYRWRQVTAVGHNHDKPLYRLDLIDHKAIIATPNHPFLVMTQKEDGSWSAPYKKRLDSIIPGEDCLCTFNVNHAASEKYILVGVAAIVNEHKRDTVYNITVDEDHTYMVDGVFVGNCQDLSVAGKKAGISATCVCCEKQYPVDKVGQTCPECGGDIVSTRSGLFMDYIRIIREMRESTNGEYPKIVVWENVPGALSSNNGDDFHAVLQEFAGLLGEKLPKFRPPQWQPSGQIVGDRGSLAWRILDAQYWGVPQRRRRIFLVVDLDGQRAGEILFKPDSLRRHTPKSRTPWQDFTEATKVSIGGSDREYEIYGLSAVNSNSMLSDNPRSGFYKTELSRTLDTNGNNPNCNQGGNVIVELGSTNEIKCYNPEDPQSARIYDENGIWHCLSANSNGGQARDGVLQSIEVSSDKETYCVSENVRNELRLSKEVHSALTTGGGKPGQGYPCVLTQKDPVMCVATQQTNAEVCYDKCPTLTSANGTSGSNRPYVVMPERSDVESMTDSCITQVRDHPYVVDVNITDARYTKVDKAVGTITARMGTGGGNIPLVVQQDNTNDDIYCVGSFFEVAINKSCTLLSRDYKGAPLLCYATTDKDSSSVYCLDSFFCTSVDVACTLKSTDYKQQPLVSYISDDTQELYSAGYLAENGYKTRGIGYQEEVSPTLKTGHPVTVCTNKDNSAHVRDIVRRLTPTEAERLQGFPDEWTAGESDSARYKAIGNSVALPCVSYVMSGVVDALDQ